MFVKKGYSLIVIKHNAEIIKCADCVINFVPEDETNGGNIVFEGIPEGLVNCKQYYTGQYLKGKF